MFTNRFEIGLKRIIRSLVIVLTGSERFLLESLLMLNQKSDTFIYSIWF